MLLLLLVRSTEESLRESLYSRVLGGRADAVA